MAISTSYPKGIPIEDSDFFVGTKGSNNRTVNYSAQGIADYLNINAKISIAGQLSFKFSPVPNLSKTISFDGGGGNNTAFSAITQLVVSSTDLSGSDITIFLGYLNDRQILLAKQNEPNSFGHYSITGYTQIGVTNFYTLDLDFIGGDGVIEEFQYYDIVSFGSSESAPIPTATLPITISVGATPDISTSIATNKLVGRFSVGTGVMEEITLGTGLSFTGSTLNVTAASTPTFQEVLTAGSFSEINALFGTLGLPARITINGADGKIDFQNTTFASISSFINSGAVNFVNATDNHSFSASGIVHIFGGYQTNLNYVPPTATRNILFPDASGTLALTSDIPTTGYLLKATASGTDTYTSTVTGVVAYTDGDAYLVRFTNGNTTGATLNVNSLGAKTLYRNNDGPVLGGDIQSGAEMLCVYNSTLNAFQCIGTSPNSLFAYVTNVDSVAITKGMPVYAFGGTGDRMTVKRALNTTDATSAQTVGLVASTSIAAGQKGLIITQGLLDGLSILPTSTWADGDPVYLGATAGTITKVKPYAPNHLVYLGVVTTASNGSTGRMYVRVQNGYELDELHNVQARTPALKDTLWYDNTVSPAQWKTASIATILGYTPVSQIDIDTATLLADTANGQLSLASGNIDWDYNDLVAGDGMVTNFHVKHDSTDFVDLSNNEYVALDIISKHSLTLKNDEFNVEVGNPTTPSLGAIIVSPSLVRLTNSYFTGSSGAFRATDAGNISIGGGGAAPIITLNGEVNISKDKLLIKGTSTGKTNLTTANTSATDYTVTLPATTGTVALTSQLPSTMTNVAGGLVPTPPNNTTTFLRGDGTFAAPAGGGSSQVKLASQTLSFGSWTLVGSFYEYTFSNANIVSTGFVNFTPNNASINEVSTCRMLPQIDAATGTCKFYSLFPPQTNIVGEIVIFIL